MGLPEDEALVMLIRLRLSVALYLTDNSCDRRLMERRAEEARESEGTHTETG
jgi:hypothetical protein